MIGCCNNVLFCSESVSDHRLPVSDREPCDALLHHLFSGLCATQPDVPACHAIAHGYETHFRVAHKLGSILSSAYTHENISLNIFRLCCVSIGLDTSEYGRQLLGKLKMKPKAREPFNSCQNVFKTLNRVESLGYCSLSEFASLHGLSLHSAPDQNDARDIIVNHFLLGECTKTNNIFCDTVSFISMTRSPEYISLNDLPMIILDGALKIVTKNPCFAFCA